MREIRQSGSEGGGNEINRSFLPLSYRWSVACYCPNYVSTQPYSIWIFLDPLV